MTTENIKNIIVIGGGFLGLKTSKILSGNLKGYAEITLITNSDYFTFYPHLYASLGKNTHDDVYISYKHIISDDVKIVKDTITDIDWENKIVKSDKNSYRGDYIVLAGGGIPFPLPKNACDMNGCHSRIGIQSEYLEFANKISHLLESQEKRNINFHIIGGGITGVEFAGRLEYLFRNHTYISANIELLERGRKILGRLNTEISTYVQNYFTLNGISIKENLNIDECKPLFDHKHSKEETFILWTSGLQNNPLISKFPPNLLDSTSKKALVNKYLEIMPFFYIGGDMAQTDHTGLAQGALHDALVISDHITCSIKNIPTNHTKINTLPKAFIIPISKYVGIFEINNTLFYGLFPVFVRFMANINFFLSFIRPRFVLSHILKLF